MSLIKTPAPPVKRTALDLIQAENTWLLNAMKQTAQRVFDLTWHNDESTPQQVCDLIGVDASKGFEAHYKLQELIMLIDPAWQPLTPTHDYVSNPDGTVTIGALKP